MHAAPMTSHNELLATGCQLACENSTSRSGGVVLGRQHTSMGSAVCHLPATLLFGMTAGGRKHMFYLWRGHSMGMCTSASGGPLADQEKAGMQSLFRGCLEISMMPLHDGRWKGHIAIASSIARGLHHTSKLLPNKAFDWHWPTSSAQGQVAASMGPRVVAMLCVTCCYRQGCSTSDQSNSGQPRSLENIEPATQ